MRALALAVIALAAIGCTPPTAGSGEVQAAQTTPNLCVSTIWINELATNPTDDPWANKVGPGYVVAPSAFGGYMVMGYDATLTTPLWHIAVATTDDVAHYQSLLETIPFTIDEKAAVGQVGSTELDTGGGNHGDFKTCITPDEYATLQAAMCVPESIDVACKGALCGTATDNCLNVVNCGTCASNRYCSDEGLCMLKTSTQPPSNNCSGKVRCS